MDPEALARGAERALNELQQASQGGGKGANAAEWQRQIRDCEQKKARAKTALDSYRLELRGLPPELQAEHQQRLRGLEESLKQAGAQVQWRRFDAEAAVAAAASNGAEKTANAPMTMDQAVATGSHLQDASKASVARSIGMALRCEEVGITTLGEMREQEEQMARIGQEMEDVKANLRRSKQLVSQIARGAARDRCIQSLCVLITISVMVMITLAMTGRDGKKLNVPDVVRQFSD